MRWTHLARNTFLGVSLFCLGLPEAEALEIFAPPGVATQMDDGFITQVRGGRGGGGMRHGGGMHRGGGGMHRAGGLRMAAECIAAAGRIAPAASIVAGAYHGGALSWRALIAGAHTEAARTVAGRPTEAALIAVGRVSRRRLPLWRLDTSGVRLGAWRRDRGRRSAWLCQRGGGRVLGRRRSGAWPVLVLHRPEPAAGLLGRLPVSSRPATGLASPSARTGRS